MLKEQYGLFLCAVSVLTRIPVSLAELDSHKIAKSCRYYALVGFILGVFQACIFWCLAYLFGSVISVIITVILGILLTGAIHEDGLADTFDGLGGYSLEMKMRIMKDSHLGVYGALALCGGFFLKIAFLIQLSLISIEHVILALIMSQSLSRTMCLAPTVCLPYLRPDQGKLKIQKFEKFSIFLSALFSIFLVLLLPVPSAWLILGITIFLIVWLMFIKSVFTGYTGDILGCTQQLSELCILAILLIYIRLLLK